MKSFLVLLLVFCTFKSMAQTENSSLFPELTIGTAENTIKSEEVKTEETAQVEEQATTDESIESTDTASKTEEEVKEEEDLFTNSDAKTNSEEEATQEENTEEDAEEEEEDEQHIYLTVDNVNATLAPDRDASFCTASLVIVNGLKKDLKKISGNFTIGEMTKDFSFTNLPVGQSDAMKYVFIGRSCERILDAPLINVLQCQVKDWTEKKCKSKVVFIQQQSSDNVVE